MEFIGDVTAQIDVAQIAVYAFWLFFALLIWYLRQEDRREGYPLESDQTGEYDRNAWLFIPEPKTYKLPHGHGDYQLPRPAAVREEIRTRPIKAERASDFSGAPLVPIGDPMLAAVGPGSYTLRKNEPDLTFEGEVKIVPLRVADDFRVDERDLDPRGARVIACDRRVAGTVVDLWVDRSEQYLRYLEVQLEGERRTVLLPINFAVFKDVRRETLVYVNAITAQQFKNVPMTADTNQVTLREEDMIQAYFGAGQLYATPERAEPRLFGFKLGTDNDKGPIAGGASDVDAGQQAGFGGGR